MKLLTTATLLLALCSVSPAIAQETDVDGQLVIELNTAQTTDTGCALTFVITNGLSSQIDSAIFETVLFDTKGQVNRLTLFDFGTLPPARPRVRQFVIDQMQCADLGRVLFNGANACKGTDLDTSRCDKALTPTTRTEIEVIG